MVGGKLIETHVGCASVVPAALIGVAGLADYAGPTGWRGLSEFLGWGAVSVAAGLVIASLLSQRRRSGVRRHAAVPTALAAVVAFTYFPYWLGLHAPLTAKLAFTAAFQIAGSVVAGALILWLAHILWTARRYS
jgi:hypothetical protein